MSAARLRRARPSEAPALSALALRSKAHWGYGPDFMAACRDELTYGADDLATDCFVVLEAASVLGFYALTRVSAAVVELEALFVEPAAIGRGHGRTLIEDAKRRAAGMGATRLVIQGDPHAAAFYRAAGGCETGTRASASIPGRALPLFEIVLAPAPRGSARRTRSP